MFAAIRYYQADPPSIDEVVRRVQEDFVPLIRDMRGFASYFILIPSEREEDIVSVSVFEDQQSAEESNRKAAEWRALEHTSIFEPGRAPPSCLRASVMAKSRVSTARTTPVRSSTTRWRSGGGGSHALVTRAGGERRCTAPRSP
jgi:heme-degrading monooxygenase HmoA